MGFGLFCSPLRVLPKVELLHVVHLLSEVKCLETKDSGNITRI